MRSTLWIDVAVLTQLDLVDVSLISGNDLADALFVVMRIEDFVEAGITLLLVQKFNQLLH